MTCERCKQFDLLLRRLYDTERQLKERNFAKSHSFSEWRDNSGFGVPPKKTREVQKQIAREMQGSDISAHAR